MSGEHNVRHWLKSRDIELDAVYVEKILAAAKRADRLLPEDELLRMIRVMRRRRGSEAPVEGSVPAFNFAWER